MVMIVSQCGDIGQREASRLSYNPLRRSYTKLLIPFAVKLAGGTTLGSLGFGAVCRLQHPAVSRGCFVLEQTSMDRSRYSRVDGIYSIAVTYKRQSS
jgi:hypothetical protein